MRCLALFAINASLRRFWEAIVNVINGYPILAEPSSDIVGPPSEMRAE